MKLIINSIFIFYLTFANCHGQTIPRGVSLSKASLYLPLQDFTCLDGSLTLPFSYVNDDYCDCIDGSDEPGTSACPNGVFHCVNNGYVPLNIPTSRVNDGICDCCDASDEHLNDNCTDTCAILGAEARLKAEKFAELMVQGNQLRLELSIAGKQMKKEKQERIRTLEAEKLEAEQLKAEAEKEKATAEAVEHVALEAYRSIEEAERADKNEREKQEAEKEALDVFNLLDSNGDKKLQVEELTTRNTFDQNKDGQVSSEELKFFMESKTELTWEEFHETTWPRLKPFYMMEKGIFTPPEQIENNVNFKSEEEDEENTGKLELGETETEEDWEKGGDDDVGGGDGESEETETVREENETDDKEETESDETSGPKYDEDTQKIIDEANKARTKFESAERAFQDLERELSHLIESLGKDYGVDDEFAPLDGQCFSYSDREYTYKLCPFDQVVQMAKSGGSETRLGIWKSWANEGDYSMMLYDKGQSCWNGPQRSTKVLVSCGLENAVVGATEPNKCEYVLDFKTPAACRLSQQVKETHDEL